MGKCRYEIASAGLRCSPAHYGAQYREHPAVASVAVASVERSHVSTSCTLFRNNSTHIDWDTSVCFDPVAAYQHGAEVVAGNGHRSCEPRARHLRHRGAQQQRCRACRQQRCPLLACSAGGRCAVGGAHMLTPAAGPCATGVCWPCTQRARERWTPGFSSLTAAAAAAAVVDMRACSSESLLTDTRVDYSIII